MGKRPAMIENGRVADNGHSSVPDGMIVDTWRIKRYNSSTLEGRALSSAAESEI